MEKKIKLQLVRGNNASYTDLKQCFTFLLLD
mgnify:CR=1 FL=1